MSVNVGSITVGMNVNLAEFESSLKNATNLATRETGNMSAAMKTQSREGAESLHLLGDAIDLKVSRPLRRVIAEMPLLGAGLAALNSIAGPIAVAVFAFEKLEPLLRSVGEHFGLIGDNSKELFAGMAQASREFGSQLERNLRFEEARIRATHSGVDAENLTAAAIKRAADDAYRLYNNEKARIQLKEAELGTLGKIGTFVQGLGQNSGFFHGLTEAAGGLLISKDANSRQEEFQKGLEAIQGDLEKASKLADDAALKLIHPFQPDHVHIYANSLEKLADRLRKLYEAALPVEDPVKKINDEFTKTMVSLDQLEHSQGEKAFIAIFHASSDAVKQVISLNAALKESEAQVDKLFDKSGPGFFAGTPKVPLPQLGAPDTPLPVGPKDLSLIEQLTNQLAELTKNTGDAGSGVKAFFLQLRIESLSNGAFAFDLLNQGLRGFEQNLAQVLVKGKTNFKAFFEGLEATALRFALSKAFTEIFSLLSQGGGPLSKALGGVFGGATGGASTAAASAATSAALTTLTATTVPVTAGFVALTASTTALVAAQAAAAGTSGASGGLSSLSSFFSGFRAEGGSVFPGRSYVVGEKQPEIFTPGAAGFITPGGGGGGQTFNIYAPNAEIGAEERIMAAIRVSHDSAVIRSVATVGELQRRTL